MKLETKEKYLLVKKYLEQHSLVESNIISFNNFIEKRMQEIVDEIAETDGEAVPLGVPEVDLVDVDVTETDDVLDGVIERVDCAEKVGDLVDVTL
jgi:DNA-directed RNA polymerase beta subunit